MKTPEQFSLSKYLLIIFALSWPFQIAYLFLGDSFRPILLVSMIMVGLGTYLCGKFIFKDGFKNAGWKWGKPKHYLYAFILALFLWLFPSIVERYFGLYSSQSEVSFSTIIIGFLLSFILTILPALGEEFSWRGYLLPRLIKKHSTRKALLLHGLITWVWHLPVVLMIGYKMGNPMVSIPVVILVSFIPTIMHAIVFAYIWSASGSLAVTTFYHIAFDEVRDSLEGSVGLGAFGQNWQMLILTILGISFLWKSKWENLKKES